MEVSLITGDCSNVGITYTTLVRNFKKFGSPLTLVRYSATAFFPQCAATSPQFRSSSTANFTVVHCYQSAIPLPLFSLQSTACSSSLFRSSLFRSSLFRSLLFRSSLFRSISISIGINPRYLIISSPRNILKNRPKNAEQRNSGSSLSVVRQRRSAIFTSPLVCYHFGSPLGSRHRTSGP